VFRHALDSELEKISSFYQLKELEIYGEIDAVVRDVQSYEGETEGHDVDQHDGPPGSRKGGRGRQGSIFRNFGIGRQRRVSNVSASINEADEDASSDEDADEGAALNNGKVKDRSRPWDGEQSVDDLRSSRELPKRRASQAYDDYSDQTFSALYASGMTMKKRIISLYVSLCELKSFIQLNKTGFTKALKKYDKTINRDLKSKYIKDSVNTAVPFREPTMKHLDENIATAEKLYADIGTKGDIQMARRELRLHLREHVVWERNTVWREMIGIERKAQAANMGMRRTLLGADHDPSKARLQGDEPDEMGTKELVTPVGRFTCPRWLFSSTFFTLIAIIAVFVVLLVVPIMEETAQQNCLAMLVFVSLLWATEVLLSRPNPIPYRACLRLAGHTAFCYSASSSFLSGCSPCNAV
jgi:phosphate transporter